MEESSQSLLKVGIAHLTVAVARRIRRVPTQRIGMVIGIRPNRISAYETMHASCNSGVRDLLTKYHMHNFSIFLEKIEDERYYLFGYYEYTGRDYRADMERLAAEPRNREWLSTADPMQIPLQGRPSWSIMREVYHNP